MDNNNVISLESKLDSLLVKRLAGAQSDLVKLQKKYEVDNYYAIYTNKKQKALSNKVNKGIVEINTFKTIKIKSQDEEKIEVNASTVLYSEYQSIINDFLKSSTIDEELFIDLNVEYIKVFLKIIRKKFYSEELTILLKESIDLNFLNKYAKDFFVLESFDKIKEEITFYYLSNPKTKIRLK